MPAPTKPRIPAAAQKAVDTIIERRLSLLWKHNGLTRVLHDIGTREQVLVLLYDENAQSAEKLQTAIEYKNGTNFRKILARLHSARLIEHAADGTCTISPSGLIEAENIIHDLADKPAAKKKARR